MTHLYPLGACSKDFMTAYHKDPCIAMLIAALAIIANL